MPDITRYYVSMVHCKVELGEDVDRPNYLMVLKASDSKAYKATDVTGVRVIGVNNDGAIGETGDNIIVQGGIYGFYNDTGTGALTKADIGTVCFVKDSYTVTNSTGSTNLVMVGRVMDVDEASDRVYVECPIVDYSGIYEQYSS